MASSKKWRVLFFCVVSLVLNEHRVSPSQEVVKKLTLGFAKALEECKQEMSIADHVMEDFYNFWRENYALVHREMGCVLLCIAHKLQLLTDDKTMHHINAHDFAKTHGADDAVAKQLVEIIHQCEQTHAGVQDDECERVLEVAKCFRTRIHQLKWAPPMEVVLEEIMADM